MLSAFSNTEPNLWLQRFAFLKPLAQALSLLGNEEFFLLLLPLVYLCLDRRLGLRLGALLLTSEALNVCLKVLCALPRPYWVDPNVQQLAEDKSFGLPSSHAQNAAAIWPFLSRGQAFRWRIASALLVAGIALSRVFLGVHYVGDVLAGVLLGVAVLWLFLHLWPRFESWFHTQNAARQAACALGIALGMIALFALCQRLAPSRAGESWVRLADLEAGTKALVARAGAMCGLLIGAGMCARRGVFEAGGSLGDKAERLTVALLGVAFFWLGLAKVLPKDPLWLECLGRFVRYAALAWWIADGTPRLLERRTSRSVEGASTSAST